MIYGATKKKVRAHCPDCKHKWEITLQQLMNTLKGVDLSCSKCGRTGDAILVQTSDANGVFRNPS